MKKTESDVRKNLSERISTDRKLELVQAVRMQNQYNRSQCRERERILYGIQPGKGELYASENSMAMTPKVNAQKNVLPSEKNESMSGFRLRFILAMILFVIFVFTDTGKTEIFGKSTEEIVDMIKDSIHLSSLELPQWNSIDL